MDTGPVRPLLLPQTSGKFHYGGRRLSNQGALISLNGPGRGSSTLSGMTATVVRSWLAVALSVAVLVAAVVTDNSLIGHTEPVLRAILETSLAIIGSLVALLAFGRFRRSGSRADLAIVCAVALLAWVHTAFGSIPDLISPDSVGNGVSERVEVWGTDVVRLLAGIFLIIAAGTAGLRRRTRPEPAARLRIFPLLVAAGVGVLVLLVWQVPASPQGLLMRVAWPASASSLLSLVGAVLFFVAASRLAVRSLAGSDPFLGWISAGCIFGGFAQVCYALLPAGGSNWLRAGDLLRAAALCTWGVGAVTEILSYWSEIAESARRETRPAVALDLHDGLAQELALLAAYTRYPEEERAAADWQAQLQLTAERALAEARRAITVLASDRPLPLATDLGRTAEDVDAEVDVRVDMGELLDGVPLTDPMQRESVVRIVREAVTNAVRHGGARHIDIRVGADDTPSLRVFDDGVGFDVAGAEHSGRLGLVSMRERAAAIGAILEVRSTPGEGTTVELLWR